MGDPKMAPSLAARILRGTESLQTGEPCGKPIRLTPFGPMRVVGLGVLGVVHHHGDAIVVSNLEAVEEGSGHVGHWLDCLPRNRIICFAEVLSSRLAGMLERRGFHRSEHPQWPDDWFRWPEGT